MTIIRLPPPRTLRALIARIQADESLGQRQCADLASSVRRFAEFAGCTLDTEATFQSLRPALSRHRPPPDRDPKAWKKSWANVRSGLQSALRRYGCRPNLTRDTAVHAIEWRKLKIELPADKYRLGLSRFMNWAERSGLAPGDINDRALGEFDSFLKTASLVRKPSRVLRQTAVYWNRARDHVPEWPGKRLTVPSNRNSFALPESDFPELFIADLNAWAACVSGRDPLHPKAPRKPLREATWRHDRGNFIRAASALVRRGIDIRTITTLSVIVQPENVKSILQFYMDRLGPHTRGTSEIANSLYYVAKNWVGIDAPRLQELARLKCRVATKTKGMSQRIKDRLHQFDSHIAKTALVNLPTILVRRAEAESDPRKSALLIQSALLIELLLLAPMRLRNLTGLNLSRHFVMPVGRKGKVILKISPEEVKNDYALEFELPDHAAALLRRYLAKARPALLSGADEGWLFPGQSSGPKTKVSIADQIAKAVHRETGLIVNPHLFRHIAAKLYLEQHPGEYETVRQLLGHKDIQTTVNFYCELDTVRAFKRHDEVVLKLRDRKAC